MPMVAWYVLSNESYMKRVIRDVFPTVGSWVSGVGRELSGLQRTALLAEENKPVAPCQSTFCSAVETG